MTANTSVRRAPLDAVALGEVLLRLDPGHGRVRTARAFEIWAGGGEYNVIQGLESCFGFRTGLVSALVRNDVGLLIDRLIRQEGVSLAQLCWRDPSESDGTLRNGLNFTERGFGLRPPLGVVDRAHSAAAAMCPGEIDWDDLFASTRPAWFHTGGVFAALGPSTAAVAMEAIEAARRHGACVSFDLNYRASLWGRHGHANRVRDVYEGIVNNVDLLIGNEGHFDICLGFTNPTASPEPDRHRALFNELSTAYPNLTILAATVRKEVSTSLHHWRAVGWSATDGYTETGDYRVEILDRVGSGDGFAAGLIAGLLDQQPFGASLEQGAAHSALVMTTPGDTSMATADEVRRVVSGAHPHIRR